MRTATSCERLERKASSAPADLPETSHSTLYAASTTAFISER